MWSGSCWDQHPWKWAEDEAPGPDWVGCEVGSSTPIRALGPLGPPGPISLPCPVCTGLGRGGGRALNTRHHGASC